MSNLSFVRHTGDGKARSFTLAVAGENIGYFRTSDIHGYVDDVEVPITINPSSPHIVTFTYAPKLGADILIRRQMPVKKTYADFARGNNFGHRQVNNTFVQQLYLTQEILDGFFPKGFYFKNDIDMGGHRLCNVGDAKLPNDAVTKYITDGLEHRISFLENSVNTNSRFIPWSYNAEGGELELQPPYSFVSARLFINGVRQRSGAMGSYYIRGYKLILAEPLEEGDWVDVELGTEPRDFIPEDLSNHSVTVFDKHNTLRGTLEELGSFRHERDFGYGVPYRLGGYLNPASSNNPDWWIPPLLERLPDGEYTRNGVDGEWVINKYYKPLESLTDISVEKVILGKACDGKSNIYRYVFTPKYYDKTVLLFSGVHGTERQAFHQLGRFLNLVYLKNDQHFRELRDNTRVVVIPVCNPTGVRNNTYKTSDEVDINRDYDYKTPYGVQRFKGVETRIIRDTISKYRDNLSFIMDWHTVAEYRGYGDIYLVYTDSTPIGAEMKKVAGYFADMFKRITKRDPKMQIGGNDFPNSVSYGWECEGVVTVIPETNENSWGTDFKDEYHCYKALEFYGNTVLGLLRSNPKSEWNSVKSSFGGRFNYQWTASEMFEKIFDPLIAVSGKITKRVLGKDASGQFDIPMYTLTRYKHSKRVLVIGGVGGRSVKGTQTIAHFLHNLIHDKYSYPEINTCEMDIVPCLNVWGMNQGAGYGGGRNRVIANSKGVDLNTDFQDFTHVESQYIKKLIDNNIYDAVYHIDSFENGNANKADAYELYVPYQAPISDAFEMLSDLAMKNKTTYYIQKQVQAAKTPENYIYQTYKVPCYKIILNDAKFDGKYTFSLTEMRMCVDYLNKLIYRTQLFERQYRVLNIAPTKLTEGVTVDLEGKLPFEYRDIVLEVDFGHPDGDSGIDTYAYTREQMIGVKYRHKTLSALYLDRGTVKQEFVNLLVSNTGQYIRVLNAKDEVGTKPTTLSRILYK